MTIRLNKIMSDKKRKPIKVVHITSHLGGGVGKAIYGLVTSKSELSVDHSIICLEEPVNKTFFNQIYEKKIPIHITNNRNTINQLIDRADILQVEWWNHPLISDFIFNNSGSFTGRLAVWFHQSGLFTPKLPDLLLKHSDALIFTSRCSLEAQNILQQPPEIQMKFHVISSACGIETIDGRSLNLRPTGALKRASYAGTLNFSKLHPQFGYWIGTCHNTFKHIDIYGDQVNIDYISSGINKSGGKVFPKFHGFVKNIHKALAGSDVFIYLLNPIHYGTAENVLIEAMAVGVLPIVLNNPAETVIIRDNYNGIVLSHISQLPERLEKVKENPDIVTLLKKNAMQHVREQFTTEKMRKSFDQVYSKLISQQPRKINFSCFGLRNPAEQFMLLQPQEGFFNNGNSNKIDEYETYSLVDTTKGSIFHFLKYYPEDRDIIALAHQISDTFSKEKINYVDIPKL